MTCSLGQACEQGRCVGGGASAVDGCGGLARGISLSQVAVYQTVSVPIMVGGEELARGARNADVIAGRAALFRVFVTPDAEFSPRPLSARVFVQNGGVAKLYFAKARIAGPSEEGVLHSTFQVTIPKSEITAASRYAVELVECGDAAGGLSRRPRFPASGVVPLGARETGGLKIRLIPLLTGAYTPDTSEAALAAYRASLLAMYPIASVDFSIGGALTTNDPSDWTGMLDQVRSQRELDKPAADVYYYGLLKPSATMKEYCPSGCTAGVGFVPQGAPSQQASQRVAVGVAFADVASAETMAHELGHNHGRDHAPCPEWGITGVDLRYPYPRAATGVYGWDFRFETLMPPTSSDIMSYCDDKWISDYTYRGLTERVASLNGAALNEMSLGAAEPFSVLLVDARGPRWGAARFEPALPVGQPEPAVVLDELGRASAITVYRTAVSDLDAHSIQVPARVPKGARLRLRDGTEIAFE